MESSGLNRVNVYRIVLLAVALSIGLAAVADALTLTGNLTANPSVVVRNPCSENPGFACTVNAEDIQLLSAGSNQEFYTAWSTPIPGLWEPEDWTLTWAANPLDAMLNVSTYEAFNYGPEDPEYGSLYAGAKLQIDWSPTPEQESLQWIQAIHTNRPRQVGPECYLDISNVAPNRPPVYPFSYADHHFYDNPSRICEPDEMVFWEAWLYLADVNRSANSVTIYEGVEWGFTVDCEPVPEPLGATVLLGQLASAALALRYRLLHNS